jgi:hypothetical protein
MPRKKPEPNIWQQLGDSVVPWLAERVLFGGHDVEHGFWEMGYDVDGSLLGEWQTELVTDPRIERWLEALRDFDRRGDKAPLIKLLQSDTELLPILHRPLTDLLFRYRITKRRDVARATPYERQVLALLDELEALRVRNQLPGKPASEIRRELDDLMPKRKLLARMLQRYDFVRRGGKQFTAAYTLTNKDAKWHAQYAAANAEVTELVKQGWALVDAINDIAKREFPLDANNPKPENERLMEARADFAAGLEAYHNKENGSSHRKEKRRKK